MTPVLAQDSAGFMACAILEKTEENVNLTGLWL